MTRPGFFLLFMAAAFVFRFWWECSPSFFLCCSFWGTVVAFNLFGRCYLYLPGAICNAAAQADAKAGKRGIWIGTFMEPEAWRHRR